MKRRAERQSKQKDGSTDEAVELRKLLTDFAYQPGYFFRLDEAMQQAKARLECLLEKRWQRVHGDVVQQGRALLAWILLCPPLLKGQQGFEWIQDEFMKLLMQRLRFWDHGQTAVQDRNGRLIAVDDQLFWEIVKNVRGELNKGRPQTIVKDYKRANLVMCLTMLKNPETGQPISLTKAVEMAARWEAHQRINDVVGFVSEVAGYSRKETKRVVASWGLEQRMGAIALLNNIRGCTENEAESLIDDWNGKQRTKNAKIFLMTKHQYPEATAETTIAQWRMDKPEGQRNTIRYLIDQLHYEELQAEKLISRWGNAADVEQIDPSPIYRALREVVRQGQWTGLQDTGLSNIVDAQKVMHIVMKRFCRKSEELKDNETDELTKEEEREIQHLTIKLWQKAEGG